MREILFRGKRVDNGKWVYGYYVPAWFGRFRQFPCRPAIVPEPVLEINGEWEPIAIKPETVGQFTGLTDKNGRKIFEGDIVVVPLSGKPAKGIVEYFKTDICGFTVITQPQYSNYVLQKNYAYEVIGNIYDNPELLGVDK